jgi:hypothetical protein
MAANWMEIATSQTLLKMSVGLLVFLPAYGLLLRTISSKMNIVDEQVKKPAKVKSTPTKSKSTPTKSKKKTATKTKK